MKRPAAVLRKNSKQFWSDFDLATGRNNQPTVELSVNGLPKALGAAYQAGLLEAQQLGLGWSTCAFSRTLYTTNFDTLLQNALQMVNLSYRITDRPEQGLDPSDFEVEEGPIHLVYVHGSILRHNPASTIDELGGLASKNVEVLRADLESRDVVVIGYGGWSDGLVAALGRCAASKHTVYWYDVSPEPPATIAYLAEKRKGGVVYVHLGEGRADGLMKDLYEALVPDQSRRDPWQRYCEWQHWIWKNKVLLQSGLQDRAGLR